MCNLFLDSADLSLSFRCWTSNFELWQCKWLTHIFFICILWFCHHFIANFKQRLAFPFYFWIVIIFSSIVISLLWISTFSFLPGEAITVTRFCNFAFLRQKKLETNVYDFLQAELLNQFQRLGESLFFFRFLFPFVFLFYISISIHYH